MSFGGTQKIIMKIPPGFFIPDVSHVDKYPDLNEQSKKNLWVWANLFWSRGSFNNKNNVITNTETKICEKTFSDAAADFYIFSHFDQLWDDSSDRNWPRWDDEQPQKPWRFNFCLTKLKKKYSI